MMKGIARLFVGVTAVSALAATSLIGSSGTSIGNPAIANKVLDRQLSIELGQQIAPKWLQHVSSGAMYTVLQAAGALDARAAAAPASTVPSFGSTQGTQGCHNVIVGKTTDVRVNQDCSFRRQAEETITVNPSDSKNLIAGQNDSRVGFNHCGVDWSRDGGATWGDQIPPFFQYVQADGHTADACSDPTEAFDSQGNAYAGGIIFDLASAANSVVVMKSNAGIDGEFFHNPAPSGFQEFSTNTPGVIATDNDPNIFNDKELMTADWHKGSPKHDDVYMTWTRFNAATGQGVGADSPIYFSQSADGGATWSPGIEISGAASFCNAFSGEQNPNACDQDQGSHPVVGWDGTIYVSFNNGNVQGQGMAQQLEVSCPPSADCSQQSSWTGPHKIADDFATQPIGPDSTTGCPSGRQCLPPNGYRMNDYGAISVAQNGHLFFTWSDYRNGMNSKNCAGLSNAATDKPPCNNDVFYSFSTNGGKTWSVTTLLTGRVPFGKTAQWQAWGAVTQDGGTYYVAFYDRSHGKCELTGCNDITLASIKRPDSGNPTFKYTRLTASSMPNLTPSNNPVQAGFLGDYMWVATMGNGAPYVVWASTDGLHHTAEEDVYFAR
jgi:hypothetical protein